LRHLPTPEQLREARSLLPLLRRMTIDQSGMGLAIFEQLAREFPSKVEGVQFTQPVKEAMAVRVKDRMEKRLLRVPDDDECWQSFMSLKRAVTATGLVRFDAEHDTKYGHADHFWACALAEAAAERPVCNWADVAFLAGQPVAGGLRERIL
jgi:phage FluMu gp28-like protein